MLHTLSLMEPSFFKCNLSGTHTKPTRSVCASARHRKAKKERPEEEPGSQVPRPLFSTWPVSVPEPTVNDARDAYETCSWIPNDESRRSCYQSMGVDGRRVEHYLSIVESLETQLAAVTSPDPPGTIRLGPIAFQVPDLNSLPMPSAPALSLPFFWGPEEDEGGQGTDVSGWSDWEDDNHGGRGHTQGQGPPPNAAQ